jgi:outer membrane protein assembly factor BamB
MTRLLETIRNLSRGQKIAIVAAIVLLLGGAAFAAYSVLKRDADISNPDATFEADNKKEIEEAKVPRGRTVDWPRFGYDEQRTKFLNAQKVKPPFRKVWKYKQEELIEFAPIINGKRMYLIDNDGLFVALNKQTGKVIWKKRLASLNASSPAFANGTLYAVSLEPPQALAVNAATGKVLWRRDLPGRAESSPIVIRKKVYFGTEPGTFYALDTKDGDVEWDTQLTGEIKAAPAFEDGTLFVGDYGGHMSAIRASDGAIEWQTSDLGTGIGGSGRFYSTPAVAFGRVYAGNVDGRTYSFEANTGEIAWTFSAGGYVYSGVAAADTAGTPPTVYFGSHDKRVYAVDAKSGQQIWSAEPGGQISGPATVIGDIAYVSTFSGDSTSGFDLGTGRRVFKFDEGEYGPVVSDGEVLYVLGGNTVTALKPVKVDGSYKEKSGFKGVIPPSELRRLRQKAAKKAKGEPAEEPTGEGAEAPEEPAAGGGKAEGGGGKKAGAGAKKKAGGGKKTDGKKRAGGGKKSGGTRKADRKKKAGSGN